MANGMFLEPPTGAVQDEGLADAGFISDEDALKLFKECKKHAFDSRWIWERGWMRNIHYVNNRQWIEYVRKSNEWRDVRLAQWFPKCTSNQLNTGVQALRAMFATVNIGLNVRPVGTAPKNVAVAALADDYSPLMHEIHEMDSVLNEADYWFIVTGNVFLHTYLERDAKHGISRIPLVECTQCFEQYSETEIEKAKGACPNCGATTFQHAIDEQGQPIEREQTNGKGVTCALSPFELAFPNTYARFSDVPYVIRLRWRTKEYYENHPALKAQVAQFKWTQAPSESALQLFRSLPFNTDMGVSPIFGLGNAAESKELGAAEYELWMRPCDKYPDGLVLRVLGDSNPLILHLEDDEAIPGPLPYKDAEGNALFTFSHAAFEQRGGRVYGTSPLDGVIQKQNLLNQLDSFILMIINRMANPLWLVPKGAEIEKFTGQPGLVVKWNPLTVGGNAKPERIDGLGPNPSLFQIREQHIKDIEEGLGTFDVLKGAKPTGVEAFSALQLLVERGQARFASAFKSRGSLYKDWFKFALEIEREFGPEVRTQAILSPARSWTMQQFKNADLDGCFEVIVEDGSMTPKTTLGIRAAIDHLASLGLIDPNDPDQKATILQLFGQTKLIPKLDSDLQSALRKQEGFEQWVKSPEAQQASAQALQQDIVGYQQQVAAMPPPEQQLDPATGMDITPPAQFPPPPSVNAHTPLSWKKWYNPQIHKQEFLKWANSDVVVEMLQENPALESLLVAHLGDIDMALMEIAQQQAMAAGGMPPPPPGKPGGAGGAAPGAGQAMRNSNQNSGAAKAA